MSDDRCGNPDPDSGDPVRRPGSGRDATPDADPRVPAQPPAADTSEGAAGSQSDAEPTTHETSTTVEDVA
ncbi:MAG: hypothetical protein QOJ83_490, partial [Frankiales bacterium]|nr:hypothetical protein [Frankiales bacterium]